MTNNADVAVVIGVGGMGQAIARRIGGGRRVVLADFNKSTAESVADTMRGEGYDAVATVVDVSERAALAALADDAAGRGRVVAVAHTAGLSPVQASAEAVLHVDLLGVAYMLDEFARVIASGGAGVVIASMAGTFAQGFLPTETEAALAATPTDELLALPALQPDAVPDPGTAYAIAKRANQLRVQGASLAWGRRGARVNSISPGVIATSMGREELAGDSGDFMRSMVTASGTGRLGTADDIAAVTAFLLGPDASFVTGTDILVDGGAVAAVRSGAL